MKKEVKNHIWIKLALIALSICGVFWGIFYFVFNGFISGILGLSGQTSNGQAATFGTFVPILVIFAFCLLGLGAFLSIFLKHYVPEIAFSMVSLFALSVLYMWINPPERERQAQIERERREEESYHGKVVPWIAKLKPYQEALKVAVASNDPEKVKSAQVACEKYITTMPGNITNYMERQEMVSSCGADLIENTMILTEAFKTNAYQVMDVYLTKAEKETLGKPHFQWKDYPLFNLESKKRACYVQLAYYSNLTYDTNWFLRVSPETTLLELRKKGLSQKKDKAKAQIEKMRPMVEVLKRHRNYPLYAGEDALQWLFYYAVLERNTEVALWLAQDINFQPCDSGVGVAEDYLVKALGPEDNTPLWLEGEALVFKTFNAWPQERWRFMAQQYLDSIKHRSTEEAPQLNNLKDCQLAAVRVLKTRQDIPLDIQNLIKERCQH